MRAVIYARYSSEMQRAASIDDQLRLCRERCLREGWEVIQIFQDRAISGASALRPAYQSLLAAAREGGFDIVVAEALDRLSRDQEDVAALFKRLRFAGIQIFTLSEGEISELHVGLKGTMNALFLKDLAAKTHRGLRGRVEAGLSGGGNAYGYNVVRGVGPDGQPITGRREINLAEAKVVTQIFAEYSAGDSPKKIALRLNAEGIPGPRGGAWAPTTINGNRARGTGIINNDLYVGRQVWNRLVYQKDPDTGRRRSRARGNSELVVTENPALRIVAQELWGAAKARQHALDLRGAERAGTEVNDANGTRPFWAKQRPRSLCSGLMRCGVCGGGFSKISATHFGCSTARNKGPTACANRFTIREDALERQVLDGLRNRMMDPAIFKEFTQVFAAEWNKMQAELAGDLTAQQNELARVNTTIDRLVDSIANGTPPAMVNPRLVAMGERRTVLEQALATATTPAPRIHPNIAEVYRQRITTLSDALARSDGTAGREEVRGLIEGIDLVPVGGVLQVDVRGELAAILTLASAASTKASPQDSVDLSVQMKMVAGIGFEPMTFRL